MNTERGKRQAKKLRSYFDLLHLRPTARAQDVEVAFQRFIAKYRPGTEAERLFTDPVFIEYLNAYLTLTGSLRESYQRALQHARDGQQPAVAGEGALPEQFTPLDGLSTREKQLLMAQFAYWRDQPIEAVHLLRTLLEHSSGYAPAWTLLGEIYFSVNRVDDGVNAYQRALRVDEHNPRYKKRYAEALAAASGEAILVIPRTALEQYRFDERRARLGKMIGIISAGLLLVMLSFFPIFGQLGALGIPWHAVALQTFGIFILTAALAYGGQIQHCDDALLHTTIQVMDRSRWHHYPLGLLLLVTGVACSWLTALLIVITGVMEDDWPVSTAIVIGLCLLLDLIVVLSLTPSGSWLGMLIFGGNPFILAAMAGWWCGSHVLNPFP